MNDKSLIQLHCNMKRVIILVLLPLFMSCNSYEYIVDSDYSYTGRFNRYKSFCFGNNPGFAGLMTDQKVIEKSLGATLQAWGYRYKEKKPDIFVMYSIYFEDFKFKGYTQPDFRLWLSENFRKNPVLLEEDSLYQEDERELLENRIKRRYDEQNVRLSEGTVLVSFVDRRKNQTVWQGYASGVFGENKEKNDRMIRSAVIQILDEYKILAFEKSS